MSATDLDEIYSREWFEHDFAPLGAEFRLAAEGIVKVLHPLSAIDVGCGPGMLVESLADLGVEARGFDGSLHAIEYASEKAKALIWQGDIRQAGRSLRFRALVICTEVAEHLDAADADQLVALLCSASAPHIIFTAAPPGQDGHHHVNCQSIEYWALKFGERGYIVDEGKTQELKAAWSPLQRLSHMTRNVVVFYRGRSV